MCYDLFMTKKQERTLNAILIGRTIHEHRLSLSLTSNSRQFFIDDRIKKNLLPHGWISEKSLANIENGHNIPSLLTLKMLSIALEIDFLTLIREIEDFINIEDDH